MPAYYNEIDPYAAAWLRILISARHIAPGDVDERDIRDVRPDDLKPYTQCHFFAGIGVWSYALRRAGWPDDRPVWTGSCPCQPFSQAGTGAGFDDERHLWPDFHWLIRERQPPVVFGEQVASKDADPWIDLVQADLEAMAYSFGAIPFPAAGVGAPNIRDRLYWVANAQISGRGKERQSAGRRTARNSAKGITTGSLPGGVTGGMDHPDNARLAGHRGNKTQSPRAEHGVRHESGSAGAASSIGGLADSSCTRSKEQRGQYGQQQPARGSGLAQMRGDDSYPLPGPANGFWRNADWLGCRDGKFRPVEPGTFPLADGAAARVGRLRAYGNAINAEAAIAFIESAMGYPP